MAGERGQDVGSGDPVEPGMVLSGGGSATVTNGSSVNVTFTLTEKRVTTPIRFSASGLPPGVTAVFTPASVTHPAPSQNITLTLTAAASAIASKSTVTVDARSGALEDEKTVALTVVSPFGTVPGAPVVSIGTGASSGSSATQVKLAAFGHVTVPFNLQIASGLSGTISFVVTRGLPSGVTAQFVPASFPAPSQSVSEVMNLTLSAGTASPGGSSVTFVAKVNGVDRTTFTFPLVIVAPFVSSVSPSMGRVPLFENPATTVTLTGSGFGPGSAVSFGMDSPVIASSVASDGTSLTVSVPPTAASGALTVISSAGVATGPNFPIDNYRNTRGLAWINSDQFQTMVGPQYSFADATALFGVKQTVFNLPLVGNVLAPFVQAFLTAVDLLLGSNGQCFGMAQTSLQFAAGRLKATTFPQQAPGAEPGGPAGPDVWTLSGPAMGTGVNVSPLLSMLVHQQHMAQFSQEGINSWIGFHASVNTAAGLRAALSRALTGGAGAIVALNPTIGDGHAVVAYHVVDTGNGNFNILLYNPNVPFDPAEDGDGSARSGAAGASVINVTSNGTWSFANFGWTGGIFGITVFPPAAIPLVPGFPMPEVLAAFGTAGALVGIFIFFVVGDAAVTQVSDTKGKRLLNDGQWNTNPATMLSGVRPMPALGGLNRSGVPAFVGQRTDALTHSITGKVTGTYSLTSVSQGVVATLAAVPTSSGVIDTISVAKANLTFTSPVQKPVSVSLLGLGSESRMPRTAVLKTIAAATAPINFSFEAAEEAFTYVHQGTPAKYTVQLSTLGAKGEATRFATSAAMASAGDQITIKPDWAKLSAGSGTITVRSGSGEVSSRPLS